MPSIPPLAGVDVILLVLAAGCLVTGLIAAALLRHRTRSSTPSTASRRDVDHAPSRHAHREETSAMPGREHHTPARTTTDVAHDPTSSAKLFWQHHAAGFNRTRRRVDRLRGQLRDHADQRAAP